MNIARSVCLFRNRNVGRSFVRKFRISTSNFESTQAAQPQVQEEKFDFEDLNVLERTERRKAKIAPFMKNVFVSVFDRELLAYPEILNKEESDALNQRLSALEKVFSNPEKTEKDRKEALKRARMYAGPVSLTHGGLAMNVTESLRYLEVISSDMNLAQRMSDHWVGLQTLQVGLLSDQYQKLIDDLTSGEHTIALCIKERLAERIAQADFRTKAELDGEGVWRITGEKWCINADGYLLVLCMLEADRFQVFLVHPRAEGVSSDGVFVSFRKTPGIPLTACGESAIARCLGVSRLLAAAQCRAAATAALRAVRAYVSARAFSGKPLSELSTVQATFGRCLLTLYASESAEYFTAGLLDGYHDPDVEMEMAMCRNFMAKHCLPDILELIAIPALERPAEAAKLLDAARRLVLSGETLDSVNFYIALNGLHHAGRVLAEEVKAIRNPLFHPTFIIKKVFADRHQERDNPPLSLHLREHLHPSLRAPADLLEYCVLRMRYASETLMSRHGAAVAAAHTELIRLAEAATEIYAMSAVLARASRSYCIGLRNAEIEMKLSACFVENTRDRVRKLILEIDDGEYLNLDHFRVEFGKKVLDTNTTLAESPITRVFW